MAGRAGDARDGTSRIGISAKLAGGARCRAVAGSVRAGGAQLRCRTADAAKRASWRDGALLLTLQVCESAIGAGRARQPLFRVVRVLKMSRNVSYSL